MESIDKVLVLGLNAVWQRTLTFDRLVFGEVNREQTVRECASGKGVNCASVVKALGGKSEVIQFVGGDTGKALCRWLDDKGLSHNDLVMEECTRVCTTLLDRSSGKVTELVGPSPKVSSLEMAELVACVVERVGDFGGVAVCGSFPQNVDVPQLAEVLKNFQGPVLVDGVKVMVPILQNGECIVKINKSELRLLTGETAFESAVKRCFELYAPSMLVVTDEGDDATLFLNDCGGWRYTLPVIKVCNPIGAGDAVSGSFLLELLRGKVPLEALSFSLAVGCASCLSSLPSQFELDKVLQIQSDICIEEFRF